MEFDHPAQKAARVLYDHYWPRFVRYFRANKQHDGSAEEIANEALLKLVRSAHLLDAIQALEKWAWMIARHTLYDHCRKQTIVRDHETNVDDGAWQTLMETVPLDADGDPVLNHCLRQQFELFTRDYPEHAMCIEHMVLRSADTADLAQLLGRTVQATREFLSQSRKKLKACLSLCLE